MKALFIIILIVFTANYFLPDSMKEISDEAISSDTLKEIEPKNYFNIENKMITTVLSRYHYKDFALDDSLSSILFDKYIRSLDYNKIYFYQSDIDLFEKERYLFDDYLLDGNIQPFFDIFNIYKHRMAERMDYVDTILTRGFDFTLPDSIETSRENSNWIKTWTEMDNLWDLRIKNDALSLYLTGKDEEAIKSNLEKRYENFTRALYQYNSEDVFQLAMNSYTTSVEPHTNYFSPITSDNFKIDMSRSLPVTGSYQF